MIGTRGVPAQYGGFETAVEEVGARLTAQGHRVRVYCRHHDRDTETFKGMELVHLPALRKRSLETLSHSTVSVLHTAKHRPDAAILFNVGNAPLIPLLTALRIPAAIHMDGLEWKRAKWAGVGAHYYKWAEKMVAKSGLPLIADAAGIQEHLVAKYGKHSHLIAYGAPILSPPSHRLDEVGLSARQYHLVVSRLEPENNVDLIIRGYIESAVRYPLVVVGSAPYQSSYIAQLRKLGVGQGVVFLGSIWDDDLLNQVYGHCLTYLHGHSVGGTNPSLLRAMGCAAPVVAFDVDFNREVAGSHGRFFSNASHVAKALAEAEADIPRTLTTGRDGQRHVARRYRWDDVAAQYEQLLTSLVRA